jgi:hypothetical protein
MEKMVERQLKVLYYNCGYKYFPGNKCKEQNIFMAISEDVLEDDFEDPILVASPKPTNMAPPSDPPDIELVISLNSLIGFCAPQTIKIIGYIKHRKVILLVDSGRTHNFIHHCISQETNCYISVVNNFQMMISNGGSMKCGGHCENVCLHIGEYHMKYHIFCINIGGYDIVLGVEWIRTLVLILMNFKESTMQFHQEVQHYHFQGIIASSLEIISSHRMENILKKGHYGIIAQLHGI